MPTPPSTPDRLDLGRGLRRAVRNAGAAALVTAAAAVCLPNSYRSDARILSDTGRAGGVPTPRTGVWAPTAPTETPGNREDGPTVIYADILHSRRLAEQVLTQDYDYAVRSWRFGRPRRVRGTLMGYLRAANMDRGAAALGGLLAVRRDPKSGLLTISAETRSPELSMQVVRRAVAVLGEILVELSQAPGQDKARFTQERLAEVRRTYAELGRQFQRFQQGNRNWEVSPDPNLRFQGGQLKQDLDLWRDVVGNLTLNHEQALLDAQNDTQTLLLLDPGQLPLEKSRPARAFLVFTAAAAVGAGSWVLANRAAILNRILAKESSA